MTSIVSASIRQLKIYGNHPFTTHKKIGVHMVKNATAAPRLFPFTAGTGFKLRDSKSADSASKVFYVLWKAVQDNHVTEEDVKHVFFYSISDQLTYRESWKCGKFWSEQAWVQACNQGKTNGLVSEHVMPRSVVLSQALLETDGNKALKFVEDNSFECVITEGEDKQLREKGWKNKTPDPAHPWKRYQSAGIKVLNVQHPAGNFFLNQNEQKLLKDLEILVEHKNPVQTIPSN